MLNGLGSVVSDSSFVSGLIKNVAAVQRTPCEDYDAARDADPPESDDDSEYDRFMDRVLKMIQPDFTRTKLNYMLPVKDKWWTVKLVLFFFFFPLCLSAPLLLIHPHVRFDGARPSLTTTSACAVQVEFYHSLIMMTVHKGLWLYVFRGEPGDRRPKKPSKNSQTARS